MAMVAPALRCRLVPLPAPARDIAQLMRDIARSGVGHGEAASLPTGSSDASAPVHTADLHRVGTSRQAPGLLMESRSADSIVDVVWIAPRSIPSSAMVCAIAGEMPEMIVLHPISTAAFAILIR